MKNTIWQLCNPIKNYGWGSKEGFSQLFNIENSNNEPQAEIWMGAHPLGLSVAKNPQNESIKLDELIAQSPIEILGEKTYQAYGSLPYLFKALSIQNPVSIQVHPSLEKAKIGYEKENKLGISLDSPLRNYKDRNHKPELIYALTPFLSMNGFRPIIQILSFFNQLSISIFENELKQLTANQSESGLKSFFHFLLKLDQPKVQKALLELRDKVNLFNGVISDCVTKCLEIYPNDIGVFAPFILNLVELNPGEAMFLKAETPHAHLSGTGLEIMANSDNVLRAGLTPKHIDIDELLANTSFHSIEINDLKTKPIIDKENSKINKVSFPISAPDFNFEIIYSDENTKMEKVQSAEILFCISGKILVSTQTGSFTLEPGESVFIAYSANEFNYVGNGVFARAFN